MSYKLTVSYSRSTTLDNLPEGVILAATRFSLLKSDDGSVVATADVSDGSLSHDFSGIEDVSLIAVVQDLDGAGQNLGTEYKSDTFTPSGLVPATAAPTYAAIAGVSVSAVAE